MLAELKQAEIEEVLHNNSIGRIGCVDEGMPYIVPVNYRYEGGYIQCYSLEGMKVQMMRRNPDVCFEVEQIGDSQHWTTVICWGIYEEVTDEEEIARLSTQHKEYELRKRATMTSASPADTADRQHIDPKQGPVVYYRIRITKFTGRTEQGY
jgi:nitroimidazol reductase NimA-like FMN-containing flavoprotein (pyridoxamine 5'-phosphate oxidase superfamily)